MVDPMEFGEFVGSDMSMYVALLLRANHKSDGNVKLQFYYCVLHVYIIIPSINQNDVNN
jgi:hypothetical protein